MKRTFYFVLVIGVFWGTLVWADSLTVPYTFSSGQKAMASEVNANFDEVEKEVTDNAVDIAVNAQEIAANADSISDIKGQLPNINALTLGGRPASDFADSLHSHPGMPVGVHWITSLDFSSTWTYMYLNPNYISVDASNTFWPVRAWAPIRIPFKCTITEMQFRARDNSDSGDVFVGIYDGTEDTSIDEYIPIASKDTSGWASTRTYTIFSTGTISLENDPTNFKFNRPLWITAELGDNRDVMRLRWVRIYYTIP